jgi:hypothetical protein
MTTAYTSLLGLALPVTGELSGTWGDTVNNSITSLLDSAIAGTTTLSTDADVTLTTTTGAANTSREAILLWTAGGTVTRNITAPAQSKIYIVINKSSSTQSIVLRGVGPTTGVTIVQGESAVCAWNGSDFIKVSNISGTGVFTSITDSGNLTFTGTGNRITGDFSNATIASRVAFQSSTTNGNTQVGSIPNGTSTTAQFVSYNNSDPTNASTLTLTSFNTEARIASGITGTGTYLPMTFYTNGSERVRIDTSGNVLVGTSSTLPVNLASGKFQVLQTSTSGHGASFKTNATSGFAAAAFSRNGNNGSVCEFGYDTSTTVGSISVTSTATTYNTSSDYRLKENIAPMTGALGKVAALKPVTYKWKSDGSDGEGFIAHELAEVCPHAVTGEKDAVDEDGNPVYQGIDTSFLVATLTAAIQELKAEFDAYKAAHP